MSLQLMRYQTVIGTVLFVDQKVIQEFSEHRCHISRILRLGAA
jgi:hypothetical protein